MKTIVIAGSSGFIGSNLACKLKNEGHFVIGIDKVNPKYYGLGDNFHLLDLSICSVDDIIKTFGGKRVDELYCLACEMGGMGYIGDEEKHGYDIAIGSTKIVTNIIDACKSNFQVGKVFYSSSACVYNQQLQTVADVVALKESDALPAWPDLLYGWQKLYSEFMFIASGLDFRIARFHNIFGRWGCYDGGKEKAPAALCRKVAVAKDGEEIEVWGTGYQTRSFLYIDECLKGVEKLMNSDYRKPLNIGSDELVTINQLAKMVIDVSGKDLKIKNVPGNVGVMGRNSDNSLIEKEIGWRPTSKLIDGIKETYKWINIWVNGVS